MDQRVRQLIQFSCEGETVMGTLDHAPGTTGLLIVSGGNEIRIGAHRGMALLAQAIAQAGFPVFRFDPRGIGDSTGENSGYTARGADIAAAVAAFRTTQPDLRRIVAFGNCDAATALLLHMPVDAADHLLLANPWVIEQEADDPLPPASAIRARYLEKLKDPHEWLRLFRGGVNFKNLFRGLKKASRANNQHEGDLASNVVAAIARRRDAVTLLLAQQDNTAIAFADAWKRANAQATIHRCPTSSHSFARESDKDWLFDRVLEALTA